jgi:Glycosyl transferases group 1
MKNARIVVTVPPAQWFGGYDRRAAFVLIEELERQFDLSFYRFDTTPFVFPDVRAQKVAVEQLADYRPDLAISLSNAGYGMACKIEDGGNTFNVFMDILGIPLMLLWDHGLFQFPSIVLSPPESPEQSQGGAIRRVADAINHPLAYHYPIDTGQVAEMKRIGLLEDRNVFPMPSLAYKPFLDHGAASRRSVDEHDLVFVGNVYLSDLYRKASEQHPGLATYYRRIVDDPRALTIPAWTRLAALVDELPSEIKRATRLDYDQSFFWNFANKLIGHGCNTQARIDLLSAIDHPLAFYGSFADPDGIPHLRNVSSRLEYKGSVDFATELPQVYGSSKILVDLTNAAFINNCSTKPICCFAAGGFALFDYKPDAIAALGPDADRVMYRDHDELNRKIDHFLTHDAERSDLANHLRETIAHKLRFGQAVYDACLSIFDGAPRSALGHERLRHWLAARLYDRPEGLPQQILAVELSDVEVNPQWPDARRLSSAPLRIQTSSLPWGYSAMLPLSLAKPLVKDDRPLWLEITARVDVGRVSIGLLDKANNFIDERFAEENGESFGLFFLLEPTLKGLVIRSSEIPAAVIEIQRLAIVSDSDAVPFDARDGGYDSADRSSFAQIITSVTSAIKKLSP